MKKIDILSAIACVAAALLIVFALAQIWQKEVGELVVAGLRYTLKFLSFFDFS